jgi:3-phosphoshikimate 1-carboxyvinyltransferase
MNLLLQTSIRLTSTNSRNGFKSETNRLLLLQALFPNITDNTSNSDDSEVMQMALNGTEELIDIHHAGTAMF